MVARRKNDFFIIGHGGSGTSLLRGILNAHSDVHCCFEVAGDIDKWLDMASECVEPVWGNKKPLEQLWGHKWGHGDIKKIGKYFKVIWIVRRYEKWKKNQTPVYAKANWKKGRKLYWSMRHQRPRGIIEVSFEDLLLRPIPEVRRICAFLHIRYQKQMLRDGPGATGHTMYNYGEIKTDRV